MRQSAVWMCGGCNYFTAAHAASAMEVLERYALLGTFAVDCQRPASPQNANLHLRGLNGGLVGIELWGGPNVRVYAYVIDHAETRRRDEIATSMANERQRLIFIYRVEGKRLRTFESMRVEASPSSSEACWWRTGRRRRGTASAGSGRMTMAELITRRVLPAAAAAMVLATAWADDRADCSRPTWRNIAGKAANAERTIAACSRLIEQPLPARELSAALTNRGSAYGFKKRYHEALTDLDRAIALDPKNGDAHATRGLVYQARGQYDDALRDLDAAIEFNPRDAALFLWRGMLLGEQGKLDRALLDYNRVIDLDPNDAFADVAFSWILKAINQDVDKAIELNPRNPLAYLDRSWRRVMKGQREHALRDLNKAIELNPQSDRAFHRRGLLLDLMKDHDAAIRDFDKAIELRPPLATFFLSRGRAYSAKGEQDRAIQDFDRAIKLRAQERFTSAHALSDDYCERGIAYAAKGDHDRAIADFSKAIELQPENARALTGRGQAYASKGQDDDAMRDLGKAIEVSPSYFWPYQVRAWVHFKAGRPAFGLSDAEKGSCSVATMRRRRRSIPGHISARPSAAAMRRSPTSARLSSSTRASRKAGMG
jgi:tetratricopeptide (TPR) repeat protein